MISFLFQQLPNILIRIHILYALNLDILDLQQKINDMSIYQFI